MRRRSRAGGKPIKTRRRKAITLKRGFAPKVARRRGSAAAGLNKKVALLTRERDETLEQQTATADVLQIISRSTFDLAKVLNTLVESAARLCEADKGVILRPAGDASYYVAATFRHTPEFIESQNGQLFAPGRSSVVGRVPLERKSVQIPDVLADPKYALRETARLGGFRTILGVPLLRERLPIGVLLLQRAAVRPFSEKQIELVGTFADQAVIAIENTRLFEAEQQRTRELTESLEQQTATSEVLQIISSSPGELEPVFRVMLENAIRLCQAKFGMMSLYVGEAFRTAALHAASPAYAEARRRALVVRDLHPDVPLARVARTNEVIHIADATLEQSYVERDPRMVELVDFAGARSLLVVPMLKESRLIGAINIYRQEVRPFTDKQIALVTNFAAQAVIAIENTRLLNELRQRTAELTEALEQQTATSDVLKIISSSPGDLEPVFEAMLASAMNICEAKFGHLLLYNGESFHAAHLHGVPPSYREFWERGPIRPSPDIALGQLVSTKQVVQIPDIQTDLTYAEGEPLRVATVELTGARTLLAVPMLKERQLVGAIVFYLNSSVARSLKT